MGVIKGDTRSLDFSSHVFNNTQNLQALDRGQESCCNQCGLLCHRERLNARYAVSLDSARSRVNPPCAGFTVFGFKALGLKVCKVTALHVDPIRLPKYHFCPHHKVTPPKNNKAPIYHYGTKWATSS